MEGCSVPTRDLDDPKVTPRDAAESEEEEVAQRSAAERGPHEGARRDLDDPREDDGWTQPESSAQKGTVRDDGWSSG
jgi:hypothetical protein